MKSTPPSSSDKPVRGLRLLLNEAPGREYTWPVQILYYAILLAVLPVAGLFRLYYWIGERVGDRYEITINPGKYEFIVRVPFKRDIRRQVRSYASDFSPVRIRKLTPDERRAARRE